MDNTLCPCSNLDWRDVDMTKEHHPDCETNKTSNAVQSPSPLAYWRLNDGNGAVMFDGTIDYVSVWPNSTPSREELMEMALKKLSDLESDSNSYIILTCFEHGVFYRGCELNSHYPCPHCKKQSKNQPA